METALVTKDRQTVALARPVHAQLKARWRQSFPDHGLSFQVWFERLLIEALELEEPK